MNDAATAIIGTWQFASVHEPSATDWLHFAATGVVIMSTHAAEFPQGRLTSRLWFSAESQSIVRIRPRQNAEGWTIGCAWEGEQLIVARDGTHWVCTRICLSEAPSWFQQAVEEYKK
jgi:hypothetical protein